MIDARELHIGAHILVSGVRAKVVEINRMQLNNPDFPYRVFVEGINSHGDKQVVGGYVHDEKIEPIPINPSLLEELGFEHGADEREWHKYIGETWLGIHLFLDRERMRVNVCDDSADYGNVIVRYLHELENFVYMALKRELIEE